MQAATPAFAGDVTPVALPGTRRRLALALMVMSGFAALGLEIVWTQQGALWLGHEAAAVLAVIAAFFGGIALGALTFGQRIDRSARPGRWYAGCEAVIGLWSLALALLLPRVSVAMLDLIGAQPFPAWHWTVVFAGTFILLLPATVAMGATLPAMERILAGMRERGSPIAALYAANTSGAVLGVLAAAFWLVPAFGLLATAIACALLNLSCAVNAMKVFDRPAEPVHQATSTGGGRILILLATTGLLGIGYEVLVVRVLSQVAENTVYTFSILLAVYLVGTALGAAAYARWLSGGKAPERLRDGLLRALAASCLLGTMSLAAAGFSKAWMLQTFGAGMAAALGAEAVLAAFAFLLPTIVMGALFSHLGTQARAAGVSFGHALGVNTLGAAIAPVAFGVLVMAGLGAKFAMLLIAAAYLALATRRSWSAITQWAAAAAVVALGIGLPALAIVDVPEGGRLVSYEEGVMATVSVVEDASGVSRLHIDNRQQEGSSATRFADGRQALLPILLHPAPRRALFLGLGTGVTVSTAAQDPALDVDAVELLPEVIRASAHFTRAVSGDVPNPRLHLMAADARRFVRASDNRYDVVVSDNFHPARSGSGSLYTVEHFRAVRDRLAPGGVFCQWLPLHQLDLGTLRSIVQSYLEAYPEGWAMLATNSLETPVVGLIARADGKGFDIAQLRQRLANAAMPGSPAHFGITDDLALMGGFIAGPQALRHFAGTAPLNTDDRPVVAYLAPRITYVPDSLPRDRLVALLRQVGIRPDELVTTADASWDARLAAYWSARDRFIEAGRDVQPTADVHRMLAQVREPLLSVLRTSPDFRPAYDPLLRMAAALGQTDAAAARSILVDLQQVQPARPEAAQVLRELATASR